MNIIYFSLRSGALRHKAGETFHRPVARQMKKNAKAILKDIPARKFMEQRIQAADSKQLNVGNLTTIQTAKRWRRLRYEV